MKLHENQLNLIRHLIRLNVLSYEDCLKFLDTENTGDMIAMSYVFRPLTKNGYVAKSKDSIGHGDHIPGILRVQELQAVLIGQNIQSDQMQDQIQLIFMQLHLYLL